MTAYQAFTSPNDGDWHYFLLELPNILLSDPNLQKLISKYSLLNDQNDNIASDYKDSLRDEFQPWPYYFSNYGYNQSFLYQSLYEVSNMILKEVLMDRYIPLEVEASSGLYVEEEGYYEGLFINEKDEYDRSDNNLKEQQEEGLKIIRNAAIDFAGFEFSKPRFLKLVRDWRSESVTRPVKRTANIFRPPQVIKVVDYFDPTINSVIKKNPELLKTLDWRVFEEMLADILRRLKYEVQLTKATKDGGIDIIALRKDENFGNHKYVLQAKRYKDAVQVAPVRELLFLQEEQKATKSCLATTSTFTRGAWRMGELHKWRLELKDQNGIIEWINKVYQEK
jgi:HJR/Mrr/RecB family endonuclease